MVAKHPCDGLPSTAVQTKKLKAAMDPEDRELLQKISRDQDGAKEAIQGLMTAHAKTEHTNSQILQKLAAL